MTDVKGEEPKNTIRQLTRLQRRVLGTLMEKGFTTPDQYPMTLKGCTTGCNQKSNREPVTEYSEAEVADGLEQLRGMGLVAEVFPDGGRTPRYRHYARHKFDFSESQFAILCELLLRGRQQPGELRTRASRMVRIDSQEQLKADLLVLQAAGFLQSSGPLERRGVEVDHTFYLPKENMPFTLTPASAGEPEGTGVTTQPAGSGSPASPPAGMAAGRVAADDAMLQVLHNQLSDLKNRVSELSAGLEAIESRLKRIERDLGV